MGLGASKPRKQAGGDAHVHDGAWYVYDPEATNTNIFIGNWAVVDCPENHYTFRKCSVDGQLYQVRFELNSQPDVLDLTAHEDKSPVQPLNSKMIRVSSYASDNSNWNWIVNMRDDGRIQELSLDNKNYTGPIYEKNGRFQELGGSQGERIKPNVWGQ